MLDFKTIGILRGIIDYCDRIEEKMATVTREMFENDRDIREIISFDIFQIGELAKGLSQKFTKEYNAIPWRQIKGMRDKIGHGYRFIDLDRVWNAASEDVKPLNDYCKQILIANK